MEPEGSSVHSQAPASCPCPEQDQSSVCFPVPLPEDTLNIFLPSTPRSSQRSLSIRCPQQNLVYTSPVPHTYHMPHPTHSFLYDHPNTSEEYRSLSSSFCSSPLPCYLVPFRPNYLLQHLSSNTLSLCFFLSVRHKPHTRAEQQVKLQFCVLSSLYF